MSKLNFTMRNGGEEKATVRVPIALSREDIKHLKMMAKYWDQPWRQILVDSIYEGLANHDERYADEMAGGGE